MLRAEGRIEQRQGVRRQTVVGIDHQRVSPAGLGQRYVARRRLTAVVRQMPYPQAAVGPGCGVEHLGRGIRRGVIDAQHLIVRQCLGPERGQTLRQKARRIPGGDEDGEARRGGILG